MREDAKLARIGDARSLGDHFVEQERVDDRRARGDLSLVARLGGHSAPCTHRGLERFPIRDHHLCLDSDGRKRWQLDMFVSRRCLLFAMPVVTSSCQANSFTSEGGSCAAHTSKVASNLHDRGCRLDTGRQLDR